MPSRRFYSSSNGDAWDLVRDSETARVRVMHTPNLASGGTTSYSEIGAFLARGYHSAECVALVELISTLIGDNDAAPEADMAVEPIPTDTYVRAAKRDRASGPDVLPGDVEKPG